MKIEKNRRSRNKTDYSKRLKLLKSEIPRVVFRKTNRYIIAQYVESEEAQDSIKMGISSKKLISKGWPKNMEGSLKSIPASYLTGYLFGIEIKKKKLANPIVDMGMIKAIHKNKAYAFLKGLKDSGIGIKCDESLFPEEEKIIGKNLKNNLSKEFKEIKKNIEK